VLGTAVICSSSGILREEPVSGPGAWKPLQAHFLTRRVLLFANLCQTEGRRWVGLDGGVGVVSFAATTKCRGVA